MLYRLSLVLCLTIFSSGCAAPLVVAGGAAAAGVVVAKDRRTAGTMLDDERIEMKSQQRIADDPALLENTHASITSYNGIVLITGEASLPMYKARIEELVRLDGKVREVRNEMVIAAASNSASRSRDAMLTTRVKSRLIGADQLDSSSIKVVSENATVYLMGLVTRAEASRAVDVVRSTRGVERIVKVFEYTD